jgi:hypothetical protein
MINITNSISVGKTETPSAAVLLEREEKASFRHYCCRARITGTPHGKKVGVEESRTGGHRLTNGRSNELNLTAAPFHQFDRKNAIPYDYNTTVAPSLLEIQGHSALGTSLYHSSTSSTSFGTPVKLTGIV